MASALTLQLFLRQDESILEAIRDNQFELVQGGNQVLVSSSVNGSSFTFSNIENMSPLALASMAQLALNYKASGHTKPITRTSPRFR